MFFGSKSQPDAQNPAPGPVSAANDAQGGSAIFEVSAADFEDKVLKASMQTPVIVDFWAPWCGPCKQLMPLLDKAVMAAGGEVLLAKVNLDENPELAQALRVQSVPTVFAFFGGRPVDAFQGVVPESQIKAFIDNIIQAARQNRPDAIDIPEALKTAAEVLAAGDAQSANAIYAQILQQDEKHVGAYVGLIRTFIAAGHVDQAAQLVEHAPEEIAKAPGFSEAKTALELSQAAPAGNLGELEATARAKPEDHEAQIALAEAQVASGQNAEAIETLLGSITLDREWNEQAARKTLLKFFEAIGHADPITVQGRKKLSSLLFS